MKEVIDSFMRERKPCSFCVFFSLKIHPALFSWHMCCHVLDGPEDTQSRNKKATRLHLVPKFPYSQGLSRKWPYMYEQLRVAISLMGPMRGAKGGPCRAPAASLLLLLVHTFIQVFHYILRAGPIPQECTRQHIRARVRWRWSRWQEKVSQVILGAVYEEGHKAYNKRGFIDRGQLTISTLGQRKGTVGVLSSHLPTPNLYSRNGTSKMA